MAQRIRSLLGVMTILVVVVPWPLANAAAKTTPLPLTGVSVVTGSLPGYRDVVLTKSSTVDTAFGQSKSVSVTGRGRIVGIVLHGTGPTTAGVALFAGRVLGSESTASHAIVLGNYPYFSGGTYHFVKTSPDTTTLPAGRYRMYLLADGSPVRVSLTLHGPTGRANVLMSHRAVSVLEAPPGQPVQVPVGEGNAVIAGDSEVLDHPGLALQAVRLDTTAYVAGQYMFCHRNGPEEVPGDGYLPICVRRDSVLANDRYYDSVADTELFVNAWSGVPAGQQSIGFTYLTESVIQRASALSLWLEY